MNYRRTVAIAIGAAVAFALVAGATGPWAQERPRAASGILPFDDPEAIAAGAELYLANCASCHGAELEGEDDWRSPGPDGLAKAPPHDETGHTWHHPGPQLFMITKYGTAALVGNGYRSNMVGFGDVLSDDEILAVLGYIKSTWPADIQEAHNERNRAMSN